MIWSLNKFQEARKQCGEGLYLYVYLFKKDLLKCILKERRASMWWNPIEQEIVIQKSMLFKCYSEAYAELPETSSTPQQ